MQNQLDADILKIKTEVTQYSFLSQFLNWQSIEKQAARKYPAGILPSFSAPAGTPFDILQAILAPAISASGPIDYKVTLAALDQSIDALLPRMNAAAQGTLRNKLSDIGGTAFWDTLGELWFAHQYVQAGQNVEMEFPLHPRVGKNQPADADIAIVDSTSKPIWLFDAICPNMPQSLQAPSGGAVFMDPTGGDAKEWIEQTIERKFQTKFASHIAALAPAKAAVIVTLIKADEITAHFLLAAATGGLPVKLDSALKTRCTGLGYAVAGRFQRTQNGIEFVKIAELN